jgi:hypothetical protein
MAFSEILWAITSLFLALVAVFWLIAWLYDLLRPGLTVSYGSILLNALVIAVMGGFAIGIYANFLR